jgi:hypothetical protein
VAGKNLLVVTTVVGDEDRLAQRLREEVGKDVGTVRIVAPAAKLSWLDWLTNDEDRARAEAREAADRVATALEGEAGVQIDRPSHDSDAVQAVVDALREFPADEVVVLTRPDDETSWLEDETVAFSEERLGVPVRHIELADEHRA